MTKPHHLADLYLSPVALAIDGRLEDLGRLDSTELGDRLVLETNTEPRTREEAIATLIADATYLIPTHGWDIDWDSRGMRLTHDGRSLVLGVPANVQAWIDSFARARDNTPSA